MSDLPANPQPEDGNENARPARPVAEKKKSKIPLIVLGVIVGGTLIYSAATTGSDDTVDPGPAPTAIPSILATPDPTDTPEPESTSTLGSDPNNPVHVEDPDPEFETMEEPPLSIEERAFKNPELQEKQAPTTADWRPVVRSFASNWGDTSKDKKEWLADLKPYVTDKAYRGLEFTELRGLEKVTVKSVSESGATTGGYVFRVDFNEEGAPSMMGSVKLSSEDWKWRVDVINEAP